MKHAERRRDEGVARNDDLVPAPDPRRQQAERQRRGPGRHPDAVLDLAVGGKLPFERVGLSSEDEGVGAQDTREGGLELAPERIVLAAEPDERDAGQRRRGS